MSHLFRIKEIIILMVCSIFLLASCKKEPTAPSVSTLNVSDITQTTASSGGNVTGDGGAEITTKGVCWSTSENPTTAQSKTSDGKGDGAFSSSLTQLTPGTKYYVRAYATNEAGTGYGNQQSFNTDEIIAATLTTTEVTSITRTTAASGGVITDDGGGTVTARGICWATTSNPTTSNDNTNDGSGTGNFTSNMSGLSPGTTYYVRAYATNSSGTSYGNEVSFATEQVKLASLTTAEISVITSTSALSGGNITDDGGGDILSRGVCWGTNTNPTTANSKTISGLGTGSFSSSLTALATGTMYYVRAYATNSAGTAYGNELSFTTLVDLPALYTDYAISNITQTSATGGGEVSGEGITARGLCWSTSQLPTIADNKTMDGSGAGIFTSNLTNLTPNTTYYVRAYATNSAGTAYANNLAVFTTYGGQTGSVSDIEGNVYNTVEIGTQVWMAENLKATKYNDGTDIPLITGDDDWVNLTSSGFCWYNNDESSFKDEYGALYNWYTINTGKLCPAGWHIPDHLDISTLTQNISGPAVLVGGSGGILKEVGTTHWLSPNEGATDQYGFKALPGGIRSGNGMFSSIGEYGFWWRSGDTWNHAGGNSIHMDYNSPYFYQQIDLYGNGFSVRCIKD